MSETSRWLAESRKEPQALLYRGTNVTARCSRRTTSSCSRPCCGWSRRSGQAAPADPPAQGDGGAWREENEAHKDELTRAIQQELGYTMVLDLPPHAARGPACSCNFTAGGIPIAPEKMLDTHIATDLIGDATFDVYDIALIVSEDSDFVPAVDFVQEMRGKHVVHVGFGGHINDLRSKCRHRIDLRQGSTLSSHAGKTRRGCGAGARQERQRRGLTDAQGVMS